MLGIREQGCAIGASLHCHFLSYKCVQRNLSTTANYGPNNSGCYIEVQVAALQRCKCNDLCQLGIELGSCNNEVAV